MVRARRHRASLELAARHWHGRSELVPGGRHALTSAEERSTGAVLDLDARPVRWSLDLTRYAERMRLCETGRALRRTPQGTWEPVTLGCSCRLCPVCARARAARTAARWRPVLQAAADDGAELRHWTLTHALSKAPGGLVTEREVDRFGWDDAGDLRRDELWEPGLSGRADDWSPRVSRAVEGESLRSAYDRLRDRLRRWRQDRATRDIVKAALPAYILGVEWTGRSKRERTGAVPRWHAHVHVLSVAPRPLAPRVVRAALDGWRSRTGAGDASEASQRCRVVEPGQGVAEVLKYPFKPADMTQAQRVECLASARGVKPHQVGGAFHACSSSSTGTPWAAWLARREDPDPRPRLHYVPAPSGALQGTVATGEPELWTGQGVTPAERHALFTWAVRDRDRGEWARWVGPAAPYLDAIAAAAADTDADDDDDDDDESE